MVRYEQGKVNSRHWDMSVKEAFESDPIRILIELIKNSADSYQRLENFGGDKIIRIFLKCTYGKLPEIKIVDNAEGMNHEKLERVLEYGVGISEEEDTEGKTTAEKGIGLKDALMALENNKLITIKDNKLDELSISHSFNITWFRENVAPSNSDRSLTHINNNGTYIEGTVPSFFKDRKFDSIIDHLQNHFLLRKLLESGEYKLIVINSLNGKEKSLIYKKPAILKIALETTSEVEYKSKSYTLNIKIYKSREDLSKYRPYGQAGILYYYGDHSVLDFDETPYEKYFGEVKLNIGELIRSGEQLVDSKREGLKRDHPFNKKIRALIGSELGRLISEEGSEYEFDENEKAKMLRELNLLFKDDVSGSSSGNGKGRIPPKIPELFCFSQPYMVIPNYEKKFLYLILNNKNLGVGKKIRIKCTDQKLSVSPDFITVDKSSEDFTTKYIEIYSDESGYNAEILAELEGETFNDKIGIEVIENPIFNPKNGFDFIPNTESLVNGGEKDAYLVIKKSVLSENREINFSTDGLVSCEGKHTLPKDSSLVFLRDVIKVPVKISCKKDEEKIGEQGTITATYNGIEAKLVVGIIKSPGVAGFFNDIKFDDIETKSICDFIESTHVITLHQRHPLIKHYLKGKAPLRRKEVLVFLADTITREAIEAAVSQGIISNPSRFPVRDLSNPEAELKQYKQEQYYEKGKKMHDILLPFISKAKI